MVASGDFTLQKFDMWGGKAAAALPYLRLASDETPSQTVDGDNSVMFTGQDDLLNNSNDVSGKILILSI
jgi:hypothetical protein